MRHGGVYIAERGLAAVVVAVLRHEVEQPVGISRTPAYDEGGTVLYDRALEVEVPGKQAHAERAGYFLGVALAPADVQHGRYAAAELCGDGALVKLHLAYDVRVESGEDAEEVRGVVYDAVVEQDEVLVCGTAAHVEAAGGLAHGLDSGKRKHGLDYVSLAKRGGDFLDDVHPHALDAHFGVAMAGYRVCGDHGAGEGGDFFFHHHIQAAVVPDLERKVEVFQRVAAEAQVAVSHGDGHTVEAVCVRNCVNA